MKTNAATKYIIISIILLAFGGLTAFFVMEDVDLGFFKISSVSTLMGKKTEVAASQKSVDEQESAYDSAIATEKTEEKNFKKAKEEYDAISDDTIKMINEATTEENYNLEYMWVKLGNYAKSNNLTILVTEPGGTAPSDESKSTAKTPGGAVTSAATTAAGTTAADGTATTTTPAAGTTAADGTAATTTPAVTGPVLSGTEDAAASATDGAATMKIQVKGSYMDISDFIFEVENDKALRFKLDNISIEYVSGTTIKANFDVKNLIIKK